jgi:hypothetical protein
VNMAKITKAQARKRLQEAKDKVVKVLWSADHYMSKGEMNKLHAISEKLHDAIRFNNLK